MTSWLIDGQMPWGSVDFGPLVEKAHLMYRASDYAQAAPGVLKGDLYFYSVEHDMRESVSLIDTTKVPLYLLTGEYDYLSTPAQSEATAAKIKGASMTTMQEIGHFPMSEDHDRFMRYLRPILGEIAGSTGNR